MSDIYVFSSNDNTNDYSTMGLVGALTPTECTFKETANGESIVELTHPLDSFGRYTALQRGNILAVPVPVRTTPEIHNGEYVTDVWTYKLKPLSQLTSAAQRTLYMWRFSDSPKVALLQEGDEVTVTWKANENDPASGDQEDNHPWKVRSKYGEGWVVPDSFELVKQHDISGDANSIQEVQSPWTVTTQYFRIYETQKSIDEIAVSARHISYDLLYNLTNYRNGFSTSLQDILDGVLNGCYAQHQFSAYTTLEGDQSGNYYDDRNPIDIFLNEEDGLCKRFGVDVIRDNYNLYFLKNPGINRGVRIQYGKNMTGIDFTTSDDEVATRIVPVGEKEDGTKLYLDDSIAFPGTLKYGSRGNTVKELQSRLVQLGYSVGSTGIDGIFEWRTENGLNAFKADAGLPENGIYDEETHKALMEALGITSEPYIDSEHINDYPIIHVYELQCENCTVGTEEDGGGKVTEEIARARMREQAEKLLENGCDQPKIEMSVEFINLGDTEEYKQFRNLENCFLYDYVIVQHPTMDIDVTAQIMEIEWDCLLDRMVSVEIGSVGKTLANTGITSWQIPNGFSGSKIAGGTIPGGALQSDIISVRHMQAESINTEALQAACVTAVKIAAGAIEATHISVEAIDAVLANIDTAVIEKAEIDWAEIASLAAEIANIAKAQITEANINQANINWANITNLSATVAGIAQAQIDNAVITSAQIDDLNAVVAEIIHAQVATGDFSLAEIKNLLANAFILEQGSANSMMIKNLVVTDANLLNATIGKLIMPGDDGKYYEVTIGSDGSISTSEVTVTDGEISAGQTDDGRQIVTTTINAESINGSNVTAQQAILGTILTTALTAGKITAGEALLSSAVIPTLYTTSIQSIGNSLTFESNEMIQSIVSDVNSNTEDLANYISSTTSELENLQGQIDGAITTWFYAVPPTNDNPPANEWTTTEQKNIHLGDLYYDTITGYCYRWQVQNNQYSWQRITDTDVTKALQDAEKAQDTADSKRRVFVSQPVPPYEVGDLWVQGSTGDILRCRTAKTSQQSYSSSDWVLASKYTDDTAANAAQATANANTTAIGSLNTRVTQAETTITQTQEEVALKATKAEVESVEEKIDGLEVGGTNLLRETRSFIDWEISTRAVGLTTVTKDENDFAVATISVNGATGNIWCSITSPPFASKPVKGKPFVASVMCMVDDVEDLEENYPTIGVSGHIKGGDFSTRNVYTAGSTKSGLTNMPEVVSGKWFKFCLYGQFTPEFLSASDQEVSWEDIAEFRVTFYLPRNGKVHWKQAKIEIGTIATDWSPAPEDTEAYISGDPPNRGPAIGRLWIDESEEPSVIRKWRGADVATAREYTETRVGCGKNLLNDASIVSANTANTTVMIDGHAVRIQGTGATYRSGHTHIYLPAGTYTIKADIAVTSGVARITRRASTDGGRTYPSTTTDGAPSGANGYTFTVERGGEWNRISFYATWATAEDGDVTYSNIRLYAGTDATEFVPYEDVPFLALDNAQGQISQVEVEVGCDVTPKNMIDINSLIATTNTSLSATMDQLRVYTTGDGGTWRGGSTMDFALRKGISYTLSAQLVEYVSGDAYIAIRNASDNAIISALSLDFGKTPARMSKTYTPDSNMTVYLTAFCSNNSILTGDVTYRGIQLEVGDEATAYESYKGLAGKDQISIVACGKNLINLDDFYLSTSNVEMDVSENSVRVYTTGDGGLWKGARTPAFWIRKGVTYTLSARLDTYVSGNARLGLRNSGTGTFLDEATVVFSSTPGMLTKTFTPESDEEVYFSMLCTNSTVLVGDCTFADIQLEIGNSATEYEPYHDMGGGTITSDEPFHGLPGAEDTVEVSTDGDVLVTRRTGVFIADGEQYAPYASTFSTPEGVYAYTAPLTGSGAAHKENFAGMCSHFTVIPRNAVQSERVAGTAMLGIPNSGDGPQAWFFTTQATAEAFNAWLQQQVDAGTPVTLVYELAVPETEALTAVAPIAPQPGQVNILTDADALTATIYGSGWEVVNDTGDLRSGLSEVDSTLAALEEEFGILGNTVAQHAEFIVSPDKIFAQVAEASKYNEQINALRVEIEANTNGITLRKEEIEAVGDRVSNIESGVHIDGSDIGLYSSDSPFETHVTHEGVVISENDMAMITVKENKMTSPRVHATDSLIFGADAAVAFRCINGHFMMLRYGG